MYTLQGMPPAPPQCAVQVRKADGPAEEPGQAGPAPQMTGLEIPMAEESFLPPWKGSTGRSGGIVAFGACLRQEGGKGLRADGVSSSPSTGRKEVSSSVSLPLSTTPRRRFNAIIEILQGFQGATGIAPLPLDRWGGGGGHPKHQALFAMLAQSGVVIAEMPPVQEGASP